MKQFIAAILLLYGQSLVWAEACLAPVDVHYVNGIRTSEKTARLNMQELSNQLASRDGLSYKLQYNTSISGAADVIESLFQKAGTYRERTAGIRAKWVYGAVSGNSDFLTDAPQDFLGFVYSLMTRLASEAVSLFAGGQEQYDEDLNRHRLAYEQSLANGRSVVMVGHSQGTLFVNDAMYLLDVGRLNAHPEERKRVSGFMIAPAAGSMYRHGEFVRGYVKLRTDVLNVTGIGLNYSHELFLSEDERLQAAEEHRLIDSLSHGFVETYLGQGRRSINDKSLAEKYPPFQRVKELTLSGIAKAIADVDIGCQVFSYEYSGHAFRSPDPLLLRDHYAAMLPSRYGYSIALTRDDFHRQFLSEPVFFDYHLPAAGHPQCHDAEQYLLCSLTLYGHFPNPYGAAAQTSVGVGLMVNRAQTRTSCPSGEIEVLRPGSASSCEPWQEAVQVLVGI